ncbi:MAG: helical backbone metal receptor [Bacteroidota bacterium]|nr:helical backbone metal receptor [Bacteroidota bacterium]
MDFTDQMQREITLENVPERIISLVPSQTELLADLGLQKEVVGVTKFCVYPMDWFRTKESVGGPKSVSTDKIRSLKPDLIIGNKEENEKKQIEELMKTENVWMSDIKTLDDACEMIRRVGELTNRKERAEEIAKEIEKRFTAFRTEIKHTPKKRVAYFIWRNPWMVAGGETFINHMLGICGFENVFAKTKGRYPEVTLKDVLDECPEIVFLSSEPYPFRDKHIAEVTAACPDSKIMLADGEYFSWYGSRLLKSPGYFSTLLSSITCDSL